MPVNRYSVGEEKCWSCGKKIGDEDPDVDVSLSGENRNHVCEACWEQVPIADRLRLQLLARPLAQSGMGIPDLTSAVVEAVAIIQHKFGS